MNRYPSKSKFDPKPYLRPGISEEEIRAIKEAFDMLDSKKVGSIDPKSNFLLTKNSSK